LFIGPFPSKWHGADHIENTFSNTFPLFHAHFSDVA
jgi:hypothetical protein